MKSVVYIHTAAYFVLMRAQIIANHCSVFLLCPSLRGSKFMRRSENTLLALVMPVKDLQAATFQWERAGDLYDINGPQFAYKAGGAAQYRPVVGNLALKPNTGKYFYEFSVNCDNTRVGICTQDVELDGEMGKIANCWSINLQTGAVEINGTEIKRLWRLVTPVSGGVCGFVFDSSKGTLQLYFNTDFQGTAVTEEFGVKGQVVYPCCGVAGIEANNRNIGVGKKGALVNATPKPYRTLQGV